MLPDPSSESTMVALDPVLGSQADEIAVDWGPKRSNAVTAGDRSIDGDRRPIGPCSVPFRRSPRCA
jgi:hypothetical protein